MKKTSLKISNYQQGFDFPKLEEKVLDYWDKVKAFEKSVEQRPKDKPYVFYDGPPFATGLPHYGHILASTIKDVVPRYWTMKGYRVERVWGWDCHGLPIENMIEKELGLKGGKKGIEELGIDKFNAACRNEVLKLDKEWEKVIRRVGRWVDFANNYKTMDKTFMESVWWAFKQLHEKGLVYEGRRVILYCPRCATPLSNFEIAMDNSYQDTEDYSITVKFKLKDRENDYLLAWTTTPWTLMGNVGLAVKPDATYVKVKEGKEVYYLAKKRVEKVFGGKVEIVEELKGSELAGVEYERLYQYLPTSNKKAFYVSAADFVSLDEGTGIVHTAAIYGEDDYKLATEEDLPRVPMLDDQGKFMDFVTPLAGQFYKKTEDWIVGDLESRNLIYNKDRVTHSVSFCYRCNTQLFYNAVPAWFIDIQKIKSDLLEQNKNINWFPSHLKEGRFGNGLRTAPDWNISRSRYWGTPMPIWVSEKGTIRVIGSVEELKEWAVDPSMVEKLNDIHREFIDNIEVWVDENKKEKGRRIPEVFDCWVESGSMPYASEHYPFENKQKFESRHPAQFIAEYIAQTRAWFYTLHVMSVALFGKHTFENAVTTGTILAEDGSKMSKSKKNFPNPTKLFDNYGVDALRLYLMSSSVMKADNINFSEKEVDEIRKKTINIFFNVFKFFKLFEKKDMEKGFPTEPINVMDKWLVSITERLTREATVSMDGYDVVDASRALMSFVNDLSTWYVRRSRNRIKNGDEESMRVLGTAIKRWTLLMAPFAPFITEIIYQNMPGISNESVHLEVWPKFDEKMIDDELEDEMRVVREAAVKAHSIRKEKGINLRQPLSMALLMSPSKVRGGVLEVLREEINVLKVEEKKSNRADLELDVSMNAQLREMGKARELVRNIQQARKEAGTAVDEMVVVELPDWPEEFEGEIKKKVLASKLVKGKDIKIVRG